MCRSVMHFVYSLASCFVMVSSPAFSVSMLTWSFPASFTFFIFLRAASTSHAIIGGTSSGSVCIVTAWSLSYNSESNYSIRSMILSCSWISLPCLSSSVIIRFVPRLCVLLTFFKLLDASIVSRISSKLCFWMSSLAFFYGLTYLLIFYVVSGGIFLYHSSTHLHQSSCRQCGARWLSGRMPDSQSREPGFESPLIPFRSLGIFFHFTTPQSTQLYKWVPGYRQWWKCEWIVVAQLLHG